MKNVQQEISRAIQAKIVVSVTKTKGRLDGGRQLVSIGPYHTAVPEVGKRYAVITKNAVVYASTGVTAAKEFIEFVGRDIAWEGLLRAYRKRGRHAEADRLATLR